MSTHLLIKLDFVFFVAAINAVGSDITEFLVTNVVSADVFLSTVIVRFAFFEAIGDVRCELDANCVFRAFLIGFAAIGEAVAGRRVGIADGTGWAFV